MPLSQPARAPRAPLPPIHFGVDADAAAMGKEAPLTPATCAALLSKQRYNPEILPQLEAYVATQCEGSTYDLDANLAVLKLYQFHPDSTNVAVVSKILLKALMKLPSTDYLTCSYLIPERVQEMELIASINSVASLLETCSFRQVWAALAPLRKDSLVGLPGFDAAVREFVCASMSITYQATPLSHLRESLAMEGAELTAFIKARGWTVEGEVVRMKLNDDNQAKPKKVDEGGAIRFDQMTKILASIV